MWDKIKENLFVVVVGALCLSGTGFYAYSNTQYKVDSKTSKGKAVLASVDNSKNIYADDLYDDKMSDDTLYWLYRDAVVNESQETTSSIKKAAKKLANNIERYYRNQHSDDEAQTALANELATYGFTGDDAAYNYAITAKKETQLDLKYIKKHYAKYAKKVLDKSPRSVYLIVLESQSNPSKTQTKKAIDAKIKEKGFKAAAEDYSSTAQSLGLTDDTGLFGYTDSDDESNDFTSSSSSSSSDSSSSTTYKIPGDLVTKLLKKKKGQSTGWVTVEDSASGTTYYVKGYVNQTNLKSLLNNSSSDVQESTVSAFIDANSSLNIDILDHYSSKLKITYKNKKVKKKIKKYLKEVRENSQDTDEEDTSNDTSESE